MTTKAALTVDAGEIKLLMLALNKLPDSVLTPSETTTRAALAYKLGGAAAEVGMYAARDPEA
jgi:hypothetical protein